MGARGDIPLGQTTPELTEYYRRRISYGRKVVTITFGVVIVVATAFAWSVSGSPIAGAGAFVAVMVMWSFGSLGFRAWAGGKSATPPSSAATPPG